jgi:hypothetical protein
MVYYCFHPLAKPPFESVSDFRAEYRESVTGAVRLLGIFLNLWSAYHVTKSVEVIRDTAAG